MTEQDERPERSQRSEATTEFDASTSSEQSASPHRTPTSSEETGGRGEDRGSTRAESPSAGTAEAGGEPSPGDERAPLFTGEEAERFRERWATVQAGFVDEPRQMVEQADELVDDLMQQLTAGFSDRRSKLEEQWSEGDGVSTEDLRVTLTRYRSFFNRLLSA
jgi:hypothetical protein